MHSITQESGLTYPSQPSDKALILASVVVEHLIKKATWLLIILFQEELIKADNWTQTIYGFCAKSVTGIKDCWSQKFINQIYSLKI